MRALAFAAAAAGPAFLFAACVVDLSGLTGGPPDGGATGGASSSSSSSGTGAAGGTTASSSSGGGSDAGTGGAPSGVLDCGPCPGSGCTPVALASGSDADGPDGIALASDGLYWANGSGGNVMRLPASGGSPQVLLAATSPTALAAAGGYVAWAEQDGVLGCTAASCSASMVKIAASTEMGSIQGVAYDGQYVFFTDQGTGANDGIAMRCPATAGCPGPLTLGSGYSAPLGISLHDAQAFWTDRGNGNPNGNVYTSPKGVAQSATQIAASLVLPTGIAADDTYLYWTEAATSGQGKVRRCPWTMGYCMTPDDLATGLSAPRDLALAGGRVYWSDSGDGQVLSCPVTGCSGSPPKVHASGRMGLRRIAVGPSCVFWTDDQGGGSVSKVAR